jgi:preprotein translocase subunit SecD
MLNRFIERAWPTGLATIASAAAVFVTTGCAQEIPPAAGLPDVLIAGVAPSALPGIGTEQAQARILGKLGASPTVSFHWVVDSVFAGDKVETEDLASGEQLTLDAQPVYTHRDIDSLRVDYQRDDSTAIVVGLLNENATKPFVAEVARHPGRRGALLINGQVLEVGSINIQRSNTITLGSLKKTQAELLAERLEVSRRSAAR